MKKIVSIFSLIIAGVSTNGQPLSLGIGDTVPSLILRQVLYHPDGEIRVPDNEKELTILDFWNTWCTSCIRTFPMVDSLIYQFENQISIIPITWQTKEEVQEFWETNSFTRTIRLPIATEDSLLSNLFGDFLLPCQVWLDNKGVVQAVTSGQYLNASNIEKFLADKHFEFVAHERKQNYPFSQLLDSVAAGEHKRVEVGNYGKFTAHLAKYKSEIHQNEYDDITRVTFVNQSILALYHYALSHWKEKDLVHNTILEVENPSRFTYVNSSTYKDQWDTENTYCYEVCFLADSTNEQKFQRVVADLNAYFGVWGRIVDRDNEVFLISDEK